MYNQHSGVVADFKPYERNPTISISEEILTLQFYANHFRFSIERLTWSVLEILSEDGGLFLLPALKINGDKKDQYCIDIYNNIIVNYDSTLGRKFSLHDATLENNSLYYKKSKCNQSTIKIDMSYMMRIYGKYFSFLK